MWCGPLHDRDFVAKMLDHAKSEEAYYTTKARIIGMLSLAQNVSIMYRACTCRAASYGFSLRNLQRPFTLPRQD